MSKKKWDKPNEILWSTVLMVGLFLMSGGENLIVLLISLGMMGLALYKLKDVNLEDECM